MRIYIFFYIKKYIYSYNLRNLISQIDLIIYIPLLFWFVIFFIIFYVFIYLYIIPLLFTTLKVKHLFFSSLMKDLSLSNLFFEIFYFLDNKNFQTLIKKIYKNFTLIKFLYIFSSIRKLIR